jgi:glycosyltransferase 2 family protein
VWTLSHKQKVQVGVGMLLAGALLYWFLRGLDWPQLRLAFSRASWTYLAGLILTTALVYVVRAWRWGYLLRPLAQVPFLPLFSATYVGFLSALFVPRAGEVLRPFLISRRYPVSTGAGFATIILERLIDLITISSLCSCFSPPICTSCPHRPRRRVAPCWTS